MAKAHEDHVAHVNTTVNVLNLFWNTVNDMLSLMPKALQSVDMSEPMKRTVLQDLSKIFYSLQALTSVTISAKLFMQQL